ncbi:hypothetical protein Goarm_015372 [Gossypium armourianum]|uniref:1-aminocyclopropane-1-carboxylate oxidase homolog 1-like n=1 Tax=Gossypium armourianum TaxID=34283 RepID=A0A7J9J8X6_9ROSI|nr:hypothetical protein [Gossypium armourianum]
MDYSLITKSKCTDEEDPTTRKPEYDRLSQLKSFDETRAGVKGLVDSGIKHVPRMFHHQFENNSVSCGIQVSIPIIDLEKVKQNRTTREEIVGKVRNASKTWGFFQVLNHGIPMNVMEEMKDGARRFFEQDVESKSRFFSRDYTKRVVYNSNFDLYSAPAAKWRDTVVCSMAPNPPKPEELPAVFRDIMLEYSKQVMNLGYLLFELLSEALGLNPDYLKDIDCAKGLVMLSHYYPICPQPELTLGSSKHADNGFLTILLQDNVGGLQSVLMAKPKPEYDRISELKAFDETKAGVKGLVDSGIKHVPRMFHYRPDKLDKNSSVSNGIHVSIPVIDLEGVKEDPGTLRNIVDKVRNASKSWGFFQVVNHGIPLSVLQDMKDGVVQFFEQDLEAKKKFFTRDYSTKKVAYNSNFDLYSSPAANWRDTLFCLMAPNPSMPHELPEVSRYLITYVKCFVLFMTKLQNSGYRPSESNNRNMIQKSPHHSGPT